MAFQQIKFYLIIGIQIHKHTHVYINIEIVPDQKFKMSKQNLSNQETWQEEKDAEEFQNYSHHVNRQQDNQTLKKTNQCRARIFRARSEKESSLKEISDLSEKLNYARQLVICENKKHQAILERLTSCYQTYKQFSINNDAKGKQFIEEAIRKAHIQCDEAKQRLKICEAQVNYLLAAYQKQAEIHKNILLRKNMMI